MNIISYTPFTNKEAGSSVRTKINTLGANVVTLSTEAKNAIDTLNTTATSLDSRLDALEVVKGFMALGTTTALNPQTVSTTPSKLIWFNTEVIKRGTALTSSIANQSITINSTDAYTVNGTIILIGGNGDSIQIEMYVNGNATGALSTTVGRGASTKVALNYSGAASLNQGDVVTLYITSTGTPITVSHSSFVIQQIK